MPVQTAAGMKVSIGPTTAAANAAAYALLAYVEIGEIEDPGEFGDEASTAEFTAVSDRRVRKLKTTFDAGTMQMTLGRDPSDTGQAAAIAALASDSNFAIKVELGDSGVTNGTTFYFHAQVLSYRTQTGGADSIIKATCSLAINTAIIEVAAA